MVSRLSARARGFTVIELVLVIAVTVTLGALLFSAQRTYLVRAQVTAGIEAAAVLEPAVEKAFRDSGQTPANWAEIGIDPADVLIGPADVLIGPAGALKGYVEAIDLTYGRLDVTYGNEAHAVIAGRRLSLTPYETVTQDVIWICGNAIPGVGLEPLGFAGGGAQSVQVPATIETRFLPPSCR
jgi:type IV pilus assembly protein PilA